MPRKQPANAAERQAEDVPRAGFTCGSYLDGHNVHYIPVLKLAAGLEPVDARLAWDDDHLTLTTGSRSTIVHNHNPAGVRVLLGDLGSRCRWYPTLRLACWPGPRERHWVSLSLTDLTPCTSAEQARLAEEEMWA